MWLREKSNGTVVKLSEKQYNKFKDTHDMSLYRVHEGNYKNGENVMIAIGGMIGVGKAQDVNTILPTPDGDKRLGDINVGDYVFDRNGHKTQVTGVFPQGVIDEYKITLKNGVNVFSNDEHIWNVLEKKIKRVNGKKTVVFEEKSLTLREIINNGYIKTNIRGDKNFVFGLPVNKPVEYENKNLPLRPYTLGAFLGDGSLHGKSLSISGVDDKIYDRIASELGDGVVWHKNSDKNYNHMFYHSDQKSSHSKTGVSIKTKDLFDNDILRDDMTTANYKFIPDIYKKSSYNDRLELIQGLMDTDGHISNDKKGEIKFFSNSEKLIDDFIDVINSLGWFTTKQQDKRGGYGVRIWVDNKDKQKLFSESPKYDVAKNIAHQNDKVSANRMPITNIEKTNNKKEMVCLMVDNPEHLYLTEHYIVTHNTTFTNMLKDRYGATAFFEPVKGNKVLDAFYKDKKRYGFLLQMNFLFQRFQMVKDAGKLDRKGETTILDRTIWEDLYFTQKNNELGNISDVELEVYKNNINIMMEEIDELPKKNADILIYLYAPFDRILSNIKKRNRGFEQSEDDIKYYKTLFDGYDQWFKDYNYSPKVKIDLTHYDLSDPVDAEIIMQKIDSELKRIKEQ